MAFPNYPSEFVELYRSQPEVSISPVSFQPSREALCLYNGSLSCEEEWTCVSRTKLWL